jgi:catechol-2,3-dioxygenase
MIMKIIELELLSADIRETERFYKKVFGLRPYSVDMSAIAFRIGHTRLIFRQANGIKPVYHFAVDVPNNRFDEAYKFIKSTTPTIPVTHGSDIADFVNWDAKSFYFYDNNGNIVEFITRYSTRAFSDEPFSGRSYISISEIGLLTNNVPELADRLLKEFGIPVFHRQPRGERFTVSGDDDGVFILAEKGREWYPTTVKAQSFHTRILFYDQGNIQHIVR